MSTVLSVDDNPQVLLTRGVLLQFAGYEVLSAPCGQQGLQLFEHHKVDLVVLDYYMPDMTGDIVAARMKRRRPSIPIIMASAHVELPQSALEATDAFVPKGEGPESLLAEIRELLRSAQQRHTTAAFSEVASSAAAAGPVSNQPLRRVAPRSAATAA